MKYLKVEGARRLMLRGGTVGLGSTSRRLERKESQIRSVLFRSPIWLGRSRRWLISDPIGDDRWRWALLLEFEVEAMSSISLFLISIYATIYGLGLLPSVFRLGFGFFFFFLGESVARGFAIICWACHMLVFSSDWFCFLIYCLGLMLGFGQWACSVTFFFFFNILV